MTEVLVSIIIIIGLFYLVTTLYQRYILKKTNQIGASFNKIKEIQISKDLEHASKLSLTGESLKQFQSCRKEYDDIKKQNFEEIQSRIESIKKDVRSLNVFKTNHNNKILAAVVNETGNQVVTIKKELEQLHDQSQQQKKAVENLKEKYKSMKKTLLAKNYLYGDASQKLDITLSQDEKLLNKFAKTVKAGDHETADNILVDLNDKTSLLSRLIEEIPPLYKNFTKEFVNQVNEIKKGHAEMLSNGYNFPDDNFDNNIKYIQKQINKSLDLLKILDLDKARNGNHQVNMMIEQLYDEMELELNSKKTVEENTNIVNAYIKHALNQNDALDEELTQLSQNYNLNHHEMEDARQLKEQIKMIDSTNQKDLTMIKDKEAVYSIVKTHQEKAKRDLSQIEAEQRKINDSVSDLTKEEEEARITIQKYDLMLHGMNRQIENLNLPGISDNYLDNYDQVDTEITKLFKSMNQEKISMDDINKQLEIIQRDIDKLNEETNSLVDNAILAEEVIQYSNRYRMTNPQIELASSKAMKLFSEDYDYAQSLSVISTALEKVEPGALQRISNAYHSNNH